MRFAAAATAIALMVAPTGGACDDKPKPPPEVGTVTARVKDKQLNGTVFWRLTVQWEAGSTTVRVHISNTDCQIGAPYPDCAD